MTITYIFLQIITYLGMLTQFIILTRHQLFFNQISVRCGLVKHRLPCFGYIVQETDKGGELLNSICVEKSVNVSYFPILKVTFRTFI